MHFDREENFFAQTGYPAATSHKQERDALTRQVIEIQKKYAAGASAALSLEVMKFLRNWLIQHIQGSDQKYRPHLNSKGIN
jgi:hemerythrin